MLLLIEHVGGQEVVVLRDRRLVGQLDPHLDPARLRLQEPVEAREAAGAAPAVGVAERAQLHRFQEVEGHVDLLGPLDGDLGQVVDLDARRPVPEHSDDAEVAVRDPHGLPDAVAPAEELVVHLVGEHDDRLRALVRLLVPARAVAERHVEHREEVGEAEPDRLPERLADLRVRVDVEAGLEHPALPARDVGFHDLGHVPVRDLRRRQRRVRAGIGLERVPAVEPHVVEDAALRRDRVLREGVAHRREGRGHRDAERDPRNDQDGEGPVALQALPGDAEIVKKHGVLLEGLFVTAASRRGSTPSSRRAPPPAGSPGPRSRRPRDGSGATRARRTRACASPSRSSCRTR